MWHGRDFFWLEEFCFFLNMLRLDRQSGAALGGFQSQHLAGAAAELTKDHSKENIKSFQKPNGKQQMILLSWRTCCVRRDGVHTQPVVCIGVDDSLISNSVPVLVHPP